MSFLPDLPPPEEFEYICWEAQWAAYWEEVRAEEREEEERREVARIAKEEAWHDAFEQMHGANDREKERLREEAKRREEAEDRRMRAEDARHVLHEEWRRIVFNDERTRQREEDRLIALLE